MYKDEAFVLYGKGWPAAAWKEAAWEANCRGRLRKAKRGAEAETYTSLGIPMSLFCSLVKALKTKLGGCSGHAVTSKSTKTSIPPTASQEAAKTA